MMFAKLPVLKIEYDRILKGGKHIGKSVREMLLSSYRVEPTGCWRWTKSLSNKGYGQFGYQVSGKTQMFAAHRAFAEMFGVNIDNALVLHSCDNPWCVNPDHLRAGTLQDNMDDKVNRGRVFRPLGSTHHSTNLTEAQVLEIRRLAGATSRKELASTYRTSVMAIGKIVRGDRWKHLPMDGK